MMALSQTTGHAIRALSCLSGREDKPTFIHDIAECAEVPQAYLAKIVKKLNDAGIVESKRGYKGGIWLARKPEDISLYQISEVLDGKEYFLSCLLGSEFCSDDRACPTPVFWKKQRKIIQDQLKKTTLAQVMAFNRKKGVHQIEPRS